MIQVRCIKCNRFLFNEELVQGVVERDCDRCKTTNRIERAGISAEMVHTTYLSENSIDKGISF